MGDPYAELEATLKTIGKFDIHVGLLSDAEKSELKVKLARERENIESQTGTAETVIALVDTVLGAL